MEVGKHLWSTLQLGHGVYIDGISFILFFWELVVSVGRVILTNYLAHKGKDCGLMAAMSISACWNVFDSARSLEQPINSFIFNKNLTDHLKRNVSR